MHLKGLARLHLDATIEDISFRAPRGLNPSLILPLASGQWIRDGQTVLVSDAMGSGKSFLACALGHQTCRRLAESVVGIAGMGKTDGAVI
ncbi:MAG: hypothetical protein F4Z78_11850 [Gammaproteobacteria bacterium]|nr:hypothetical protein [Gammaproteobacteria bacterium]